MGEKEIKAVVLNYLINKGQIDLSSIVFNEMSLARNVRRLDLGFVQRGEMVAIEVKSEKDSLFRFSGQVEEYLKYFDRVVAVVAPKFVDSVVAETENDVAVWMVSSSGLKVIRKGRINRKVTKECLVDLMTKREVSLLAKRIGVKLEGVAMYELKIEVVSRLNKISKADVKRILLDGISKRFTLPSNRFLTAVVGRGKVEVDDVSLLSPYLNYLRKN
ncbi:sce7726 family protein [Pseudomonas lactis]|uniref:sce7726 family protein n=1 Tax=Pseudomonas lactis TaxID=1615674 RepID=UPI00110D17E5|nr:sce7726 family protein [Pseudomonas lactis]